MPAPGLAYHKAVLVRVHTRAPRTDEDMMRLERGALGALSDASLGRLIENAVTAALCRRGYTDSDLVRIEIQEQ